MCLCFVLCISLDMNVCVFASQAMAGYLIDQRFEEEEKKRQEEEKKQRLKELENRGLISGKNTSGGDRNADTLLEVLLEEEKQEKEEKLLKKKLRKEKRKTQAERNRLERKRERELEQEELQLKKQKIKDILKLSCRFGDVFFRVCVCVCVCVTSLRVRFPGALK